MANTLPRDPASVSFHQRLSMCITLPLVLMVLLAGLLAWQIKRLHAITDEIHHSDDTLSQIHHLDRLASDLDSGLRAYLLSGNRANLDLYNKARPGLDPALARLRTLVSAAAPQAQRADKLRSTFTAWTDYSRKVIEQRGHGPVGTPPATGPLALPNPAVSTAAANAATVASARDEVRRIDPIRAQIASLIRNEETEREQLEGSSATQNRLALGLTVALSFLVGGGLAWFFGTQLKAIWNALTEELRKQRKITEDREAEIRQLERNLNKTQEREMFYRGIVQGATEYALFKVDREGRILSWNRGAEKLTGFRQGDAMGEDFGLVFGPEAAAQGAPLRMLKVASTQGKYTEENWRARSDGTVFWAETQIHSLRNDAGELDGFSVTLRDLSPRRRADRDRLTLLSQVEEAAQARDQFLSIASHEIKVPAMALSKQIQGLLLTTQSTGTLKPVLEGFKRQTDRLYRVADEMVDLSRIHSRRLGYRFKDIELRPLVEHVVEQLRDRAAAAGSVIEISGSSDITGNWDGSRLEQVIHNLLTNAIRFSGGKPIVVSVGMDADRAIVAVQDQGPGIERERQNRIFERFSSTEGGLDSGLGLGLYISRQIVEGHGGHLQIESSPGTGSTFVLDLPFKSAAETATGLNISGLTAKAKAVTPSASASGEPG